MKLSVNLSKPGDFITDDNNDAPILIVRNDPGHVNAFVNSCRHRGARLADGIGHVARNFMCPYHAWSYDKMGHFVHAPSIESFAGFDFDSCRLTPLGIAERDGLIWVRPGTSQTIDIENHLAGLESELANFNLDTYHQYETRDIECHMNWKAIVDTFLEAYHFAPLHKETVGPLFFSNLCLMDTFGRNLRETLPRRSIIELKSQPEKNWDLIFHSAIVYVLFPNTVFVMQRDHVEIWRCFPVGNDPSRSRVQLSFYTPEPATTKEARLHWEKNIDLTVRTVLEEDFQISKGAQKNFSAEPAGHVIYGKNEPALAHFQRSVTAAIE